MVQHEQLAHTLVADAVLAWQDERVGEELLADGADQLPLYVLDRHLRMRRTHMSLALTTAELGHSRLGLFGTISHYFGHLK